MTITLEDFPDFFRAVNDGHDPFPWQLRLLHTIAETGIWPSAITAPTGSGKSAVVEVHIFLNALHAAGNGPRVPRRLSTVVARRALVDSQADRAERIAQWLESGSPLATTMRELLCALASSPGAPPLVVGHLRGGIVSRSNWIDDPAACAIISATPDMWGSRLLLRGYGTSIAARPREAGLLGMDNAVVIDEAHLSRQLLATARWVAKFNQPAAELMDLPGLQVVESSATVRAGSTSGLGITEDDYSDPTLAARLTKPKLVTQVEAPSWSSKKPTTEYIEFLAAQARRLGDTTHGTVGCIVNLVDTAVRLADELGNDCPCWVGPMRPMDLTRMKQSHPSLLSSASETEPPPFLVATQTIEVGVDLDLAGLVTELAPAENLTQRFGRVNRRGLSDSAQIVVVCPEPSRVDKQPIYSGDDLDDALSWLAALPENEGASPKQLLANPPTPRTPERAIVKLPHVGDVMRWEASADQMWGTEDLELWIRDSLEPDDAQVGLVVRGPLPEDDSVAIPLLAATPVDQDEVFPAKIGTASAVVTRILESKDAHARVFMWRNGELSSIDPEAPAALRPGDLLIVDAGHPLTRHGVVVSDANAAESYECRWGAPGVHVIQQSSDDSSWLSILADMAPGDAQALFDDESGDGVIVVGPANPLGEPAWIVVTPQDIVEDDEETRQGWTRNAEPVHLDAHQRNVAARAARLSQSVGLEHGMSATVELAAAHHDDGKADRRFQVFRLGNNSSVVLAKSTEKSSQRITGYRGSGGLPPGWRHELRSVAVAWSHLAQDKNAQLAARLIGMSHGRGRMLPQLDAAQLASDTDDAATVNLVNELFVEGGWPELVEETANRYGTWGCAYLESLVRAADCQVSKEGS